MFTDDELKSIYKEFGIKNNDFLASVLQMDLFQSYFSLVWFMYGKNCH